MNEEGELSYVLERLSARSQELYIAWCLGKRHVRTAESLARQSKRARVIAAERAERRAMRKYRTKGWHYPNVPETPSTAFARVYDRVLKAQLKYARELENRDTNPDER